MYYHVHCNTYIIYIYVPGTRVVVWVTIAALLSKHWVLIIVLKKVTEV